MKRFAMLVLALCVMLLAACGSSAADDTEKAAVLLVSDGAASKTYTRADLETLPVTEAVFNNVAYKGVTISALFQDAGFALSEIKAIKAVAADGYSVNYDTSQGSVNEFVVAYAQAEGDLVADDGSFRMVIEGAEGKLNVRMLVELQVIR